MRSSLSLLLTVWLLAACKPLPPLEPEETQAAAPPPASPSSNTQSGAETTPASDEDLEPMLPPLNKEDLAVGEGPAAQQGDTVQVHYTGTLLDGTVFDSSLDRGVPFEFTIGEGNVITGWELGVVGMQVGGKRLLVIPPHLGYGSQGAPPKIPPDSVLKFTIELLGIDAAE